MTVTARKYNPGFLSDDDLVASFCVRTGEFASMVEVLRDSIGNANTHQIVIGPRGSGKTSLLLRVAAEIRRDAGLSARFFPIVFAEESYEVSTAGEFWLECLSRLADQAPGGEDSPDLHRTFEELRQIQDDRTLGDRCLGVLQDFADREGRRLVMLVENLNMMFRDIADDDAGWRLRQTLQNDPRFLLLASATSRFDEIDKRDFAFYDLFRTTTLHRLDTDDCATLWRTVSGRERAKKTIRALQILTGGSPRLLTILARFGGKLSFRELMADLLDLVDDHTEYFKSHLDALPPQERRVYLALADLWKPASAREIADRARLDTSKCSAQLARLTEKGAVEVTGGSPRRKLYYLTERLYNIYYLMRRARGPAPMIEALIRFMEGWYSAEELREFGVRMVREASALDSEMLGIYRTAFQRLLRLPSLEAHREELLSIAQAPLALAPAPFAVRKSEFYVPPQEVSLADELVRKALALATEGRLEVAVEAWDDIVQRFGTTQKGALQGSVAIALVGKGAALLAMDRPDEALSACDEVLRRFGTNAAVPLRASVAFAMERRGAALLRLNRRDEAMTAWSLLAARFGQSEEPMIVGLAATALENKAVALLGLNRLEDALAVSDEVVRRFGGSEGPEILDSVALALVNKGAALLELNRAEEALNAWGEVERRFGTSESRKARFAVRTALLGKAIYELESDQARAAIASVDRLFAHKGAGSTEIDCLAHMVRVRALLIEDNGAACVQEFQAVLVALPRLGTLPKGILDVLSATALALGLEKTRDLIRASPAADLLLPLTTALELELGLEPRVAKEVEEVAEDIRRDMAERREAKSA